MIGILIAALSLGGLALIAWALAYLFGWWAWPLFGGAVCIFLAVLIPGRAAWGVWLSGGLLRHVDYLRRRWDLPKSGE